MPATTPKRRTRRKSVLPPPEPLHQTLERIELETIVEEKKVTTFFSALKHSLRRFFNDSRTLTKGEFLRFLVLPFCLSFLLLLAILFGLTSKDTLRIPSFHVKTSLHSFSDFLDLPSALFGHTAALRGQEIYDPYQVKLDIDNGSLSYILIDLRSQSEFGEGHIRDAINLPIYTHFNDMKDLSLSESSVMAKVHQLIPHKKPVVIYSYTRDSQLTKDVAAILSRNGLEVSTLGVGWNEWRHFVNLWVPEPAWDTMQIENYVDGTK